MEDILRIAYLVSVVGALWASGLELGMREAPRAFLAPFRRVALLGRVAAVDVLVLPVLVWVLVHTFDVPTGYAIGLLLVGVASAGPLGVKATQIAGADATLAVSLVVVLELVNLAAIPVWASVLLPAGTELEARPVLVTLTLLVALPIVTGGVCSRIAPGLVRRVSPALPLVANVALATALVATLARDGDVVWRALGARVPLVAIATVLLALCLGWLAGGPEPSSRTAAALVTGIRANAVALAVAGTSFAGAPEVRAGVAVFALFSITLPLVFAVALGRRTARVVPA